VRLELLGAEGSLVVGLDENVPLRSAELGVGWPTGPACPGFMARFRTAYETELAAFVDLVAGRITASPCTAVDALEAFYIAEACDVSRREHRPVPLAEVRR
jgi:myo-inositol 2-dehydrogenase / D-chiro-inositol 1-dehydrogenase